MSEGFKINLSKEAVHKMTSLYPWESRPTSRRRRRKIRRYQAWMWRMKKNSLLNPIVAISVESNADTGLKFMITKMANGDQFCSTLMASGNDRVFNLFATA